VVQMVEALRCKPEGRGFLLALGANQPLTEKNNGDISGGWGLKRPVLRADNLTTFMCRLS